MQLVRSVPVTKEAWQFEGGADNATPIIDWILAGGGTATWMEAYQDVRTNPIGGGVEIINIPEQLSIRTLEGTMQARVGDYIIRGLKGEFYPCKPDVFKGSYEPLFTLKGE